MPFLKESLFAQSHPITPDQLLLWNTKQLFYLSWCVISYILYVAIINSFIATLDLFSEFNAFPRINPSRGVQVAVGFPHVLWGPKWSPIISPELKMTSRATRAEEAGVERKVTGLQNSYWRGWTEMCVKHTAGPLSSLESKEIISGQEDTAIPLLAEGTRIAVIVLGPIFIQEKYHLRCRAPMIHFQIFFFSVFGVQNNLVPPPAAMTHSATTASTGQQHFNLRAARSGNSSVFVSLCNVCSYILASLLWPNNSHLGAFP